MTKKEQKASPITPASKVGKLVKTNGTSEEKNVPRWKTVDVFLFEKCGVLSGVGLILDGEPHTLYTHVYQNLEMTHNHAISVLERLKIGKDYIVVSKSELKAIEAYCNVALQYHKNTNEYVFLTEYGYNRLVMEVNTSGMKNQEIATRIEQRKTDMAEVFVKFKRGELIQIDVDVSDYNKKDTSALRGIRNDIIKTLARKKHPSNPDTVRRIIGSYHNDFTVIHGEGVQFVPGWLKDANESDVVKTVAHTAFDISALAAGKLEVSERREFEDVLFKQFCPGLRPIYLTESLDTTRQTQLLVEGEV